MIRALWRDGVVYGASTVIARGTALLLVPLVTHLLSPADYGALDLIVTVGVLINLVVPLEISQALARFWNERAEGVDRRRLADTAWTFTVASHAVFAATCALCAVPIAQALLGDARYASAVRAGGCAIALNGAFYLLQNRFRWELRPRAYFVVSTTYASANLVLVAAFGWGLGGGLEGVLWAQTAAAALAVALSLTQLRGGVAARFAHADLVAMLRFSMPLVVAGVALFASFYANRFMLNALGTLQDVGVFGIASRLASVVTVLLAGIQGALTPLIYAHYQEPETPARLARLFEGFSAVALATCLALGLFGSDLVALLAPPDYVAAAPLLGWLAVAALLPQMYIFAPGVAIRKKTHWQLAIALCSAVTSIGLNALLIPPYGVWGATLATLAAAMVFFGAWIVASQRLYRLPLRHGPLVVALGLFVLLGLTVPQLDAVVSSGVMHIAVKAGVLLAFVVALGAIGLLRPRDWQRGLATAG